MGIWRTNEKMNSRAGDYPRFSDGRWVDATVFIRDNATGEVRETAESLCLDDGRSAPNVYIWEDGNYACNCNRSIFFARAGGVKDEDIEEHDCGDGAFSVKIINPVDGEVIYDEFDRPTDGS